MNKKNFTTEEYWNARQDDLGAMSITDYVKENEWIYKILPSLNYEKENLRMFEIGCNPGHTSLALLNYIDFEANGVDFNRHDERFVKNIISNNKRFGRLYSSDIRNFNCNERFDLVFSCGFIEHFGDFNEIIEKHFELVEINGYALIIVPNFRYIQYIYHWLFDREDLLMHNIECMDLDIIKNNFIKSGMVIVDSGHAGKIRFWNYTITNNKLLNVYYKYGSKIFRVLSKFISAIYPFESKYFSPWMYVLAKKIN